MNYAEALKFIHSAPKLLKPLGNVRLKTVLEKLGSPEKSMKFIHIAGTNGKGSTSAMTEAVLRAAGYNTGLFTSPFIEKFNERIKVNGVDIDDNALADITTYVSDLMKRMNVELAEFSIIFVIALLYFRQKGCDIIVLEAGLGGRLDATNSIDFSIVSAITSIGFDHMQYLGNTISEIAAEKAGIIKTGGTVVLYPDPCMEVLQIFREKAASRNAELTVCNTPETDSGALVYKNKRYNLSLKGEYQYSNAAVCLEIIEKLKDYGFIISNEAITAGFNSVKWPGRFEWLTDNLLLDGCHNIDGVREFAKSIKNIGRPVTIVTGVMADKDYRAIAEALASITPDIIVTKPDVPRALEPSEYKKIFQEYGVNAYAVENSVSAVKLGLEHGGICAVCGSLYLIGEIRSEFYTKLHIE